MEGSEQDVLCVEQKRWEALSRDDLYEILRARMAVFVVEQRCAYQDADGIDQASLHVMVRDAQGHVAAYLRMFPREREEGILQIGRVLTTRRGQGLARRILSAAIERARATPGVRGLCLEAQVQARGLYEKAGFVQASDVFDEDGIPHILMRRTLGGGR